MLSLILKGLLKIGVILIGHFFEEKIIHIGSSLLN